MSSTSPASVIGVGPAAHGHAAVGAAVPRVDDDALARQPRPGAVQALLLAQQARAPAGDLAAEVAEVTQGAGPHMPSGLMP